MNKYFNFNIIILDQYTGTVIVGYPQYVTGQNIRETLLKWYGPIRAVQKYERK